MLNNEKWPPGYDFINQSEEKRCKEIAGTLLPHPVRKSLCTLKSREPINDIVTVEVATDQIQPTF